MAPKELPVTHLVLFELSEWLTNFYGGRMSSAPADGGGCWQNHLPIDALAFSFHVFQILYSFSV